MNLDKLREMIHEHQQDSYDKAVHELSVLREIMDLEPLDEPLHHMTLYGYEVVDGIGQERQRIKGFDWSDFIIANGKVEDAADSAFCKWLDGMNLRYEAISLGSTTGAPTDWYATKKVLTLAKLAWGGA